MSKVGGRMKKSAFLLVLVTVLILLSGCDYYIDEHISITYDEPDIIGVNEYEAGVSTEKNAARIFRLGYEIDVITDGQIKVTLPEKIKDEIGTEYPKISM